MKYDYPLTDKEFNNPYLINIKKEELITIDNKELSAEYIWSLNSDERKDLIKKIIRYYREKGFPYEKMSKDEINEEFNKLKKFKSETVVSQQGYLKNSAVVGLNITRFYNNDLFYKVSGEKVPSLESVFYDDNELESILQNRMGWYTSKEDGEERPYIFGITDSMIIQGIHSSGKGFNVSQFKPAISKYLYEKYAKKKVFDYSCGWGARALGALSLGLEYYGTDPLTADNINKLIKDLNGTGFCVKGGSEISDNYKDIPMVDCILSSPPYFTLENYSSDKDQSTVKYSEYSNWINEYWDSTVKNSVNKLESNGYFILIMKDVHKKYNLLDDMTKICLNNSLTFEDDLKFSTTKNHLSGKAKTKVSTKNSEIVRIFKKI